MGPTVSHLPASFTIVIRELILKPGLFCGWIVDPIWEEQVRPLRLTIRFDLIADKLDSFSYRSSRRRTTRIRS